MNKKRIVVIDDVEITLYAIEQNLESDDREIHMFKNPETAEAAINNMGGADCLITDLKIEGGEIKDTIGRIKRKYPATKIAIITGNNKFSEEKTRALGADRLFLKPIDWQSLNQFISPPDIPEGSIPMLYEQLTDHKDNYMLQIIEGMDIGISIVDAERNVVFVNKKQEEISGEPEIGVPCYRSFSQGAHGFCEECPITLGKSATHARPGGYFDIQCIPLMNGEKIIGYAKLSKEVTDRERLISLYGNLPLKNRIETILEGIKSRGVSRVRMYMISEGGKYLIGYCSVGQKEKDFIGKSIPIDMDRYAKETLDGKVPVTHSREKGYNDSDDVWLKYFPHKKNLKEWGAIPILKDGIPLGLVTVDNYDESYPDITHEKIRPLDIEVLKEGVHSFSLLIAGAVEADLLRRKDEIRKMLVDSDIEIYKQQTLTDMLQVLIEELIIVIKTYWSHVFEADDMDFVVTGHIMKRNGKWLDKIAGEGILYDKGIQKADRYKDKNLPCVRVFNNDQKMIVDHIGEDANWIELLQELKNTSTFNTDALEYMKRLQSFCCVPIKLGDEMIGTMSIQSPKPYLFNEYIIEIISGYVSKCSPALKSLHLIEVEKHLVASMSGLTIVIDHLLRNRENEDKLIWTMLTGLTHHEGLGYNRAVYFDCVREQCSARYGVGPLGNEQAENMYMKLDLEKPSLYTAIQNAAESNKQLTEHIKGKKLVGNPFNEKPQVLNLVPLAGEFMPAAREVITVALSYEGRDYGALLVDNFVTGVTPSERDKDVLKIAGSIFSLIIHNLRYKMREDELLSMIFHRLRTDIAGPLNAVEVALKRNDLKFIDLPLIREKLFEVFLNTNDLLYYSKSAVDPSASNQITKVEVNIGELIAKSADQFFSESARIRGIVPDKLLIQADKNMLKHAITNLIDNALKYSVIRSEIQVLAEKKNGNICISVLSDPDPKIAEIDLRTYFDRFEKGPNSDGAGIGLYIVQTIVNAHGGDVIAEMKDDKVVFGFCLPVKGGE